jgi:mannose-6-phosphate isomerase-like protein (cupin superfamily)
MEAKVLNIAEVDWQLLPDHHDGAYSKLVFGPETEHGALIDYRISSYQPKGYVARHAHKVQEQVYHVLEGEGVIEIDDARRVVRRHDVIFIPPGVAHAIRNTGLDNLVFLVITVPPKDQ